MTSPVQEMISSEMAEMKSMEESNDPALDLKLCNDSDGQKESSPSASQSSNEVGVEVEAEAVVMAAPPSGEERKSYYCKYCKKKFSNSQALGGHQNAHKRERAVAKTEKGLLEAARASIERCLYPFSTISAYSSGYGAASFSSLLGVQRQSLIHKPGYHGGIGYSGTTGGWPGYSNHNRPFPVTNRPAPMVLMNNYWGRDGILGGGGVGGYQPSPPPPPPPPQARPFNIGGYQPAPPPSASNVWAVGASRPADHRPGGALLQFQRQEAQVGVPATEKQIAPAIDLTLKL